MVTSDEWAVRGHSGHDDGTNADRYERQEPAATRLTQHLVAPGIRMQIRCGEGDGGGGGSGHSSGDGGDGARAACLRLLASASCRLPCKPTCACAYKTHNMHNKGSVVDKVFDDSPESVI